MRQPRKDRKPPGAKMGDRVSVKFTPDGRGELVAQAKRAGFASVSAYLRTLAENDRQRLGLTPFIYQERTKPGS